MTEIIEFWWETWGMVDNGDGIIAYWFALFYAPAYAWMVNQIRRGR